MASLCVVEAPASTNTSHEACSPEPDGDDKRLSDATASTLDTETTRYPVGLTGVQPCSPKGLTRVLRHVGLIEGNETEIARISLSNPMDDEVSQEIRSLQRQLEACVRETNETKRKLWRLMDEYVGMQICGKRDALTCGCAALVGRSRGFRREGTRRRLP